MRERVGSERWVAVGERQADGDRQTDRQRKTDRELELENFNIQG